MNEWTNKMIIALVIASNLVAVVQLFIAVKWPRIARILFFLLFTWAAYTNWQTSHQHPEYYLDYAVLSWNKWYTAFIRGWFAQHITVAVGSIAVCQLMIAVSMLLKGRLFVTGVVGAMVFFMAILPLGAGAAFPSTALLALAMYFTTESGVNRFIWQHSIKRPAPETPVSFN